MFAAESHTSRHHIAIVAMACLFVLLGGPPYAAGAESLIIAGATYYEPGVSGPGWAWTDADHLELNGYVGEAIGADGDLVLTLAGQNSVTESHAPDADITLCGMEVWGNLTLRSTGTLTATGSQCGIHVSRALVVDGCTVDARADGADITDEAVAGVIAGDMAVRGGGRVVAAGAGSGAGVRAYGVYLQDSGISAGAAGCQLSVDASWLDAAGAAASHVVVKPDVATPPAGETDGRDVPGHSADKSPSDTSPAAGEPTTGPTANPTLKPAAATTKKTTTVTKTTVAKTAKPKPATATTSSLPKTGDSNWIAASVTLFLLGTVLLAAACRC